MDRFKGQIFKIPNLITLFRILIIIPYIIFFLHDNYILAVFMLLLSGLSDLLDGIVARKFNQITELGKVLDPVADKLTLLAVVISLGFKFPEIIPLAVIYNKEKPRADLRQMVRQNSYICFLYLLCCDSLLKSCI